MMIETSSLIHLTGVEDANCVFFHSISVYDSVATDLVLRTGYALVFPEFNLAPEAQWPEQQEQCFEVLEWMLQNGNDYNVVPDKFAIVADSAAGKPKTLAPLTSGIPSNGFWGIIFPAIKRSIS